MSSDTEKPNESRKSPALFAGMKYSDLLVELNRLTIIASNRKDFKTWCELLISYYGKVSPFLGDKGPIWAELEKTHKIISSWRTPPSSVTANNMFLTLSKLDAKIIAQSIDCLMKTSGGDGNGTFDPRNLFST